MKIVNRIKNQSGLTIIEVLIASATFMIGFTIMAFFLGEIVSKYSSKDKIIAYNLARQYMETTLVSGDFTDLNETKTKSGVSYKIERMINKKDNLIEIRINISREKSGKLLVSLYNEKFFR